MIGTTNKRRDRRAEQSADHSPAERRVLFPALAKAERHRQHAQYHGRRRHQHGPEPR